VTDRRHLVLCNGAPRSALRGRRGNVDVLELDYMRDDRVRLALSDFAHASYHIPNRCLDLIEIAAYVLAADRLIHRGPNDSLEFSSWGRNIHFHIRVRDTRFWKRTETQQRLAAVLEFLSGDTEVRFTFLPGQDTAPTGIFDTPGFQYQSGDNYRVTLFSGGLDSLTGAIDSLLTTTQKLCLVSHRSGLPSTAKTQDALLRRLKSQFPDRVLHYKVASHLSGGRAPNESQRTRSFLYASIAFSLAHALGQNRAYFYENGVTSVNLPRRQDLLNARASRTTHPRSLYLMSQFLSCIAESEFSLENPYRWSTKADVLAVLKERGLQELVPSAVSCSRTAFASGAATHCGHCLQCVDRRFASFGAGIGNVDHSGLYTLDFITHSIQEPEARTVILDYVRLGLDCESLTVDGFLRKWLAEITDCLTPGESQSETIERLHSMFQRFGRQTVAALKAMRNEFDDPRAKIAENSLLALIQEREYLKDDTERLAVRISEDLRSSVPRVFRRVAPKNENDLNDKIDGLLQTRRPDYEREFPACVFALSRIIPDHMLASKRLLIETKYVRKGSVLSRVSDEVAADITKHPSSAFSLFIIYDPASLIFDRDRFAEDFKFRKPNCRIEIIS
jgi:7-cyano-7-deazaguanine synthase in queuosine biosynthesis